MADVPKLGSGALERDTPTWEHGGVAAGAPGGRDGGDRLVSHRYLECVIWEMNWSFSAQFPVPVITALCCSLGRPRDAPCQPAAQPLVPP